MKKKSYLINFTLLFFSLIICFIFAEIGLRIHIFNDLPLINNISIIAKQRDPLLYTDPDSEDNYWIIRTKVEGDQNDRVINYKPHPLLGWIDSSKKNYIHNNTNYVGNRMPVLMYGDSFTQCAKQERCYQEFLNNDREFSTNHFLLNYGVGGYGVDQIYLLFKNSVDIYRNPFVVIGIYTRDLDRSILSFQGGAMKPRFRVEKDTLQLDDQPLILNPIQFVQQNPPHIKSYLYRRIMKTKYSKQLLPKQLFAYLTCSDYYQKEKILINEKIILELIKETRSRNLDFVFIIFEQYNSEISKGRDIGWRVSFLKNIFEKNNVPFIWTRSIIQKDNRDGKLTYDDYFIKGDGHPTAYLNGLVSLEIKKHILIK